jgi:hypothetical protein
MILVDDHPLVQAVDHKIADLKKRRAEFERHVTVMAEQDEAARVAHDKALSEAMNTGAPAPPPLALQLNGADIEARHQFNVEEQQLTQERRLAVGKAYPNVLKAANAQAAKVVKGARPNIERLMADMTELAELLGAVRACRDAANYEAVERREYRDARMDVQGFIALVAGGGDPLGTLDLMGNRGRKVTDRATGLMAGDIQQLLQGSHVRPQPVDANRSSVA